MDNINFLKTRLASMDSFYKDIHNHYDFGYGFFAKYQKSNNKPFDPEYIAYFFRKHGFGTISINGNSILIRRTGDEIIDGLAEINNAYELFDKEYFEQHKDKILSEEVLRLI